jgi:hypothetical protein
MNRLAEHRLGSAAFPARGSLLLACALLLVAAVAFSGNDVRSHVPVYAPPQTLFETGLYSDPDALVIDPDNLPFSPQYPLWTDGASKSRWVRLPPGGVIDGSDPDAWTFPIGTRFWKEFSFGGRRIETRYMELLADGQWLYAAYEWTPDGREAVLAPEKGRRNAFALGGGRSHAIPGTMDCKVCHQGGPVEVLGFSALQLSPARDPRALHAEAAGPAGVDLDYLIGNGFIDGFDTWAYPPPIIEAASETERVLLGYMHGNCGHCHNSRASLANLGLFLRQELLLRPGATLETMVGQPVGKSAPGQSVDAVLRIEPGHPERSALLERVSSRYPALQMPPLGTALVDEQALALFREWIVELGADHGPEEREDQL